MPTQTITLIYPCNLFPAFCVNPLYFLYITDTQRSSHSSQHLYEGDIKLTEEQRLNSVLFGDPDGAPSRAATNVDKIKWPNAVIPYEFDCSVGELLS